MHKFIFTLFALLLSLSIAAQTSLRGQIVAESNKAPIMGAKVTLAGQNISTTSNANGEFTLLYLEPMDEELIIEAEGYISDIVLVLIEEGKTTDLGVLYLKQDIQREVKDELVMALSEAELNDDEGKSQSMASGSSASQDVFNNASSYGWSSARYRGRGYDQTVEQTYNNGISFN